MLSTFPKCLTSSQLATLVGKPSSISSRCGHVAQGRRVYLGFRPEHMQLADVAKPPKGHISVGGEIKVVEPMGHETLLTCDGGFGEMVGKYEGEKHFLPSESIYFHIRTDRLHFFDLESGIRI